MRTFTDIDPADVPGVPKIAAAVAATEVRTVEILRGAAQVRADEITGAIHDRSSTLRSAVGVRTRRLPGGGVVVSFGAVRDVAFSSRKGAGELKKQDAFYADFVDRGTGERGPLGRKIQRKGLIRLGNTVRAPSGIGQAPQLMFTRAAAAFDAEVAALDALIDAEFDRQITVRS